MRRVKAGYNLSSLKYFSDNDENFNEEFISGYQVGLVYHAALGDALSFQPEVAYYTSGGNSDFLSSAIERSYQNLKVNALLNLNVIGSNDGYILGAGVKLNKFIVSVRGSFGVTELASFDGLGFTGNASIKSREFSLVGVLLF